MVKREALCSLALYGSNLDTATPCMVREFPGHNNMWACSQMDSRFNHAFLCSLRSHVGGTSLASGNVIPIKSLWRFRSFNIYLKFTFEVFVEFMELWVELSTTCSKCPSVGQTARVVYTTLFIVAF